MYLPENFLSRNTWAIVFFTQQSVTYYTRGSKRQWQWIEKLEDACFLSWYVPCHILDSCGTFSSRNLPHVFYHMCGQTLKDLNPTIQH